MREREANAGIDPGDDAAQWLDDHEPKPEVRESKSAYKSKALHRWRQRGG